MNALACVLATSISAAGVDYGWQPTPDGDVEYVIQIEPAVFEALRSGQEITSEIPPELAGVRRFRIRVGSGPVPRIMPTNPHFGPRNGTLDRTAAANVATPASARLGGGATSPAAASNAGQPSADAYPRGPMTPRMASANDPASTNTNESAWAERANSALDRLNRAKGGGAQLYDPHAGGTPPATATVSDPRLRDDRVRIPDERSPVTGQPSNGPAGATIGDRTGGFQPPLDPRHLERYKDSSRNAPVTPAIDYPKFDNPPIPPRPDSTGTGFAGGYAPPPSQPNLNSEFPTRNDNNVQNPNLWATGPRVATAPRPTLPGFANGTDPAGAAARDPSSREPDSMFAPRPLKEASYTEPAPSTPAASIQMGKPSLPESAALQPYKPWGWFVAVLFGFLISLSANFYLGWIAYDLHRRYRSAVLQMTDAAALGV